ncbi:MAG: alpha/beta fold hydrolase, partial [Micrococcales bacterium]|nr:alpha/beta fold hydrolase [Micrococcales bacterium]
MAAPVVLVHGFGGSPGEWVAVAGILRDARHEVRAPPLPGHGARAGTPFRVGPAVEGIAEAIEACPAPPILVGRGLGGHLAVQAAVTGEG